MIWSQLQFWLETTELLKNNSYMTQFPTLEEPSWLEMKKRSQRYGFCDACYGDMGPFTDVFKLDACFNFSSRNVRLGAARSGRWEAGSRGARNKLQEVLNGLSGICSGKGIVDISA